MRNGLLWFILLILGIGGLLVGEVLTSTSTAGLLLLAVGTVGMGVLVQSSRRQTLTRSERESYAWRLRGSRERERAFYELATTLSLTLDFQKVLEATQEIGRLALRDPNSSERLISVVFLFQGEKRELHPRSSRGLTQNDARRPTAGKQGVLGLALQQDDPVFAINAKKDPELSYYAGLQACLSIVAIPLRAGFEEYGVMIFGSEKADAFSDEAVDMLKAIGKQATIALQNAFLYQKLLTEKERIVEVEEDARKKLARDLHDGPTQNVAMLAMRVNYIRRSMEQQPQQAMEELGKVEELARRTTKEIRHMLFTMRPLILETQGLVAALHQLSEKMRDTHNTNVVIESEQNIEKWMDSHAQGVAFYIIEEAVNNARKHAQSDHIWVRLKRQGNSYIILEIEDDGVGFNISDVTTDYHLRGSLGMVNMKERAELIEAQLHLHSKAGVGTKITVTAPIKHQPSETTEPVRPTTVDNPLQISAAPPTQPQKDKPNIPYATKRSPGV